MKSRQPYESITFKPSEDSRKRLLELSKETGRSVSSIVSECTDYALGKVELKPIKQDIFFRE
jgi:predicted DNA-binding protein